MNKKLIDVMERERFFEFYIETIPAMQRHSVLILPNEWEYHLTLNTPVFYYNDNMFAQVACKKCSSNKPHECNSFNSDLNEAFKILAQRQLNGGLK